MILPLAALVGCVSRPVGEVRLPPEPTRATYDRVEGVDILFVVDNSPSTRAHQQRLTRGFPALLEALRHPRWGQDPRSGRPCTTQDAAGCNLPDLHLGVVSTDLGAGAHYLSDRCHPGGDRGRLQVAGADGCARPAGPFIVHAAGKTNIPSVAPAAEQIARAFSCIVDGLGTSGCSFGHPLEAVRLALDDPLGDNEVFLRQQALLAVVLMTEEDDCSAISTELFDPLTDRFDELSLFRCFAFGVACDEEDPRRLGPRHECRPAGPWLHPIEGYVDFFRAIKPAGRLFLAALAGPPEPVEVGTEDGQPDLRPSCRGEVGIAGPAIRIAALVDALGPDGRLHSICDDHGPALGELGGRISAKLVGACVDRPLLTDQGELACAQGDSFGSGITCATSCLHRAVCEVFERGEDQAPRPVPRCPTALWYPGAWRSERDCRGVDACPCWRLVAKRWGPGESCVPSSRGSPYALDILRGDRLPGGTIEASCLAVEAAWDSPELDRLPRCEQPDH